MTAAAEHIALLFTLVWVPVSWILWCEQYFASWVPKFAWLFTWCLSALGQIICLRIWRCLIWTKFQSQSYSDQDRVCGVSVPPTVFCMQCKMFRGGIYQPSRAEREEEKYNLLQPENLVHCELDRDDLSQWGECKRLHGAPMDCASGARWATIWPNNWAKCWKFKFKDIGGSRRTL